MIFALEPCVLAPGMTSQTRRSLAWAQFLAQLCFPTRHLPQASPDAPRALALNHRRAVPACVLGPCSCLAGASRPSPHVIPAPELQNRAQGVVAAVRIRVRKSLERLSPVRAINPECRAPRSQELMTNISARCVHVRAQSCGSAPCASNLSWAWCGSVAAAIFCAGYASRWHSANASLRRLR